MTTATRILGGVLRRPTSIDGLVGWLATVDAKRIGILYGMTAFVFFMMGGMEALIMRTQLLKPENSLVDPARFNQMFTMHGTTMIFLAIMPLNAMFFNFLLPLMIGARDVAFPRLNAFSYWLFLFGGLFLNASFLVDSVPDSGWFSYANLTSLPFTPGKGVEFWTLGLQILGVASMASSFNFLVTVFNMRAPGMTFMRLPMFVWMTIVVSVLIVLAFPVITVALILLSFDRIGHTGFFLTSAGGDPVLWQHLFWVFGHPEVYILILPPMGVVSEIIPVFSRKPLFGYKAMVMAGAVIGLMGWVVWSHHMFAVGLGPIPSAFFATSTMAIAVPTGVKIFNWLATMWRGQLTFKTPMLFALGFIGMFIVGGLSGVMHASPPSDLQQTDTYFIVAHLHYVLFGGSAMGIFAGIYFWFPKMTGKMLGEGLGKLNFWLFFIGGNIAFFPMHFTGMNGMPRRVYTYGSDWGVTGLNIMSTIGAYLIALGVIIFLINVCKSLKSGKPAGNDPWDAATLEWSVSSPPPYHNFDTIPVVRSARPLWDTKHPELQEGPHSGAHAPAAAHTVPAVAHAPAESGHGAAHGHIHLPSPSYWPLILSFGLTMAAFGLLYTPWLIGIGLAIALLSTYGWALEPVTAEAE